MPFLKESSFGLKRYFGFIAIVFFVSACTNPKTKRPDPKNQPPNAEENISSSALPKSGVHPSIFEHINEKMYDSFLATNIDPQYFDLDQELVQRAGPFLIYPTRKGKNTLTFEIYLPYLPNFLQTKDAFELHIDPVINVNGQKTAYRVKPLVFEIKEKKNTPYFYAKTDFEYEGHPVKQIRLNFSIKLPLLMREINIVADNPQNVFEQYNEIVTEVSFDDQSVSFSHEGTRDHLLGITGFTLHEKPLSFTESNLAPLQTGITHHAYQFDQEIKRANLYMAKSFLTRTYGLTLNLDRTYIKAGSFYFTLSPYPNQYYKKSINQEHEIKTNGYHIEIHHGKLSINKLSFGKIKKQDWIHLEDRTVYLNNNPINQ